MEVEANLKKEKKEEGTDKQSREREREMSDTCCTSAAVDTFEHTMFPEGRTQWALCRQLWLQKKCCI